jgi:hypothetical protein
MIILVNKLLQIFWMYFQEAGYFEGLFEPVMFRRNYKIMGLYGDQHIVHTCVTSVA